MSSGRNWAISAAFIFFFALAGCNGKNGDSDNGHNGQSNTQPVWSIVPADISIASGQQYFKINGEAADGDRPSEILTCLKKSDNCSFDVGVIGIGSGAVSCIVFFNSPSSLDTCSVDVEVSDTAGHNIAASFQIGVQKVWYVNDDATGSGTGLSWRDAFNVIQDGVDAASAGEAVWVAEGTYVNLSPIATKEIILMKDGVDIIGGFAGNEISEEMRGDPLDFPATLKDVISSDPNTCVIGASNSRIDGFIIKDCDNSGMYNFGVHNMTISKCKFLSNSTPDSYLLAGAIYNGNSSLSINDCNFTANIGSHAGGAIHNSSSSVSISGTTFNFNVSNEGGAIFNSDNSEAALSNCLFTNNSSGSLGCIYNYSSYLLMSNCILYKNTSYNGAALFNDGFSTALIENSIILSNINIEIYYDPAANDVELYNAGLSLIVNYSDLKQDYLGEGNIFQDPLFNDTFKQNFHLLPGSPCRDAGRPDIQNNDPDGTRNDMGAYGGQNDKKFDSDYDGIEDWYEILYHFNPYYPTGTELDPDKDTLTNFDEFMAGTNPYLSDVKYVDINATGASDGSSWDNAFNDIQQAIDSFKKSGVIFIAKGIYQPMLIPDKWYSLLIDKELHFYGGFAGNENSIEERKDPAQNSTIIDGEKIPNGNSNTLIYLRGASRVTFDGLEIRRAISGSKYSSGILFSDCILTLGNFYSQFSNMKFSNTSFINSEYAVSSSNSTELFDRCTFEDNHIAYLGALYSNPGFQYSSFYNNGLGIQLNICNGTIDSCSVASCYWLGAMIDMMSYTEISNSLFLNNYAEFTGAAINSNSSYMDITNSTFVNNHAQGSGGAIYNLDSSIFLKNCILWSNSAATGDQIYNDYNANTYATYSDVQGGYTGNGNIDLNPMFDTNYRLLSGSPCIDAGTTIPGLAQDLDGNPRPSPAGGAFDMGAYEYQWP